MRTAISPCSIGRPSTLAISLYRSEDVRLHLPRARAGITQARPRIEVLDHADGDLDMLHRPPQPFGDFLVLPGLHQAQAIRDDLPGHATTPVDAFDLQQ